MANISQGCVATFVTIYTFYLHTVEKTAKNKQENCSQAHLCGPCQLMDCISQYPMRRQKPYSKSNRGYFIKRITNSKEGKGTMKNTPELQDSTRRKDKLGRGVPGVIFKRGFRYH